MGNKPMLGGAVHGGRGSRTFRAWSQGNKMFAFDVNRPVRRAEPRPRMCQNRERRSNVQALFPGELWGPARRVCSAAHVDVRFDQFRCEDQSVFREPRPTNN